MKKWLVVILSVLFIAALAVWFSCSPFAQKTETSYDVLDESGASRLVISCAIKGSSRGGERGKPS
jgi:hypothetical protein